MGTAHGTAILHFDSDARIARTKSRKIITDSNPSPSAWQLVYIGSGDNVSQIATNGSGTWVALHMTGLTASVSLDHGLSWAIVTLPAASTWDYLRYGGGRFMMLSVSSVASAYSTDGINWVQGGNLPATNLLNLAHDGVNTWYAGNSSAAANSTNGGVTWNTITLTIAPNGGANRIAGGNGVLIQFHSNQQSWRSTDGGQTWTANAFALDSNNGREVVYGGNGRFYSTIGSASINYTDDNGASWTGIIPQTRGTVTNDAYLAIGSGVMMLGTAFQSPIQPSFVSYDGGLSFNTIARPNINIACMSIQHGAGIFMANPFGLGGGLLRWKLNSRTSDTVTDTVEPALTAPGSNVATVTVTGQTDLLATDHIDAWLQATDSTATHNAYEHRIAPIKLAVMNVVPGVGFDIVGMSEHRLTGDFKVRWARAT